MRKRITPRTQKQIDIDNKAMNKASKNVNKAYIALTAAKIIETDKPLLTQIKTI